MRAPARTLQPSAEHGLTPFLRTIVTSTTVGLPFYDVRQALRVCLPHLVTDAFSSAEGREVDLVANVSMRHWSRLVRVPVDVDIKGAYGAKPGLLAHLHWRARRLQRLFPVMEADLLARPTSGEQTQLIVEATYHPPFGALGLTGDLLLGRLVAHSTADAFTAALGRAMEEAVHEGRCGAVPVVQSGKTAA